MTGCRASTALIAVGAVLSALSIASPAAAQSPRADRPEGRAPAPGPMQLLPPPREAGGPRESAPPPPGARIGVRIGAPAMDATVLAPPDPESVGLIGPSDGGFGAAMWRGTDRRLVARLLPRLPARTQSRIARDLAVRLLTTRAVAPVGASGGQSLLEARIERLVALGAAGDASRLATLASIDLIDTALAKAAVEALFMQSDIAGACGWVDRHALRFEDGYWRRAQAFCMLISGERDRAAVLVDILRERGGVPDVFLTLFEALVIGETPAIAGLAEPSGLDIAMMRVARAPLPPDILDGDRPNVLLSVIDNPTADFDLRLAAAERAFGYGLIAAARLGEIYDAVPPAAGGPVAAPGGGAWTPRDRALFLRAARAATGDRLRAELLRDALARAAAAGVWAIMAAASRPILETISPAEDLRWFARDAMRALAAAGAGEHAARWFAGPGGDGAARAGAPPLWALGQFLAGSPPPGPPDRTAYEAWLGADGAETGSGGGTPALFAVLLDALDRRPDWLRWSPLLGRGSARAASPDAGLAWRPALADAAAGGRIGETVLIALLGLTGPDGEPGGPGAYAAAADALRRVGLTREARGLALEAALRGGL